MRTRPITCSLSVRASARGRAATPDGPAPWNVTVGTADLAALEVASATKTSAATIEVLMIGETSRALRRVPATSGLLPSAILQCNDWRLDVSEVPPGS
jgi:hypothetical protein